MSQQLSHPLAPPPFPSQQERILTSWVSLVDKSGIYEHYNPLTGEAYGAVGLGMSTLVCDWIYKYGWDKL